MKKKHLICLFVFVQCFSLNILIYAQTNYSLRFSGVVLPADNVTLGNPLWSNIGNNSCTFEAWVKRISTNPVGLERIIAKDYVFQLKVENNLLYGHLGPIDNYNYIEYPYPTDSNWHHVALVRDKNIGKFKLFIDGIMVVDSNDNSGNIVNSNSVNIGSRNAQYEPWFGYIDEVRISKVVRYSNNFTPQLRFSNDSLTLGLYHFDEGTGNITYDSSNNHINGLITGATWSINDPLPFSPVLISPANGSTGVILTPTLFWNIVTNATAYKVEVSPINNFSYIVDSATITTTQRTIPPGKLNVASTYFWRVRGVNSFGNGPWSDIWSFSTLLTSIQKTSSEIPTEYKLYANFPNPFNPYTNIKFDTPKSSMVKIIVYNILGKEITSLVNEKLSAGSYEVDWNANEYPSGVYFYKIEAGEFVQTKNMLLLK